MVKEKRKKYARYTSVCINNLAYCGNHFVIFISFIRSFLPLIIIIIIIINVNELRLSHMYIDIAFEHAKRDNVNE